MHDTAFHIGTLAMNIYGDLRTAAILEIGSMSVNGSLRENVLPTTKYVGVDLEQGEGVDLVVQPGKPLPFEDNEFDLVMATSVFEHDPCFWMTFLEMVRATKDGGYIYVNAPSNGVVHRFPQDNWRFYPDSGRALVQWAISQGQPVTLVESFIADREKDLWNDFVAVFRKGRITRALPKVFVHEHVPCSNVSTWKSKETINPRDETEDLLLLRQADERTRQAEATSMEMSSQCDSLTEQITQLNAQLSEAEKRRLRARAEYEALEARLAEAGEVRSELQLRESELRQRHEEIEQTRTELEHVRSENGDLRARLAGAKQKVELEEALRNQAETILAQWKEMRVRDEAQAAELAEAEKLRVQSELRYAKAELEAARTAAQNSESALSERYQELGKLAALLRQQEQHNDQALEHVEWLVALHDKIRKQPRWWTLMPRSWRRQREGQRLQRSGIFDSNAYLERYADVAAAGVDALDHYVRHGIREGRSRAN